MARTRAKGRPILGGICGLLFGFFLSLTLSVYASVPLDSILYFVLTAAGLVVGIVLGVLGPFGRRTRRGAQAAR
jgi:xanthine/uracil permease